MNQPLDIIARTLAITVALTLAVPGAAKICSADTCSMCTHGDAALDGHESDAGVSASQAASHGCCSQDDQRPIAPPAPAGPCGCPPACCAPSGAVKLICPFASPVSASLAPLPILRTIDAPQTINPSPATQDIFRPPRG